MPNAFQQFLALLPERPLQVGLVLAVDLDHALIELPGGGRITARGTAAPGTPVFVRDGLIEGPAPELPIVVIDV